MDRRGRSWSKITAAAVRVVGTAMVVAGLVGGHRWPSRVSGGGLVVAGCALLLVAGGVDRRMVLAGILSVGLLPVSLVAVLPGSRLRWVVAVGAAVVAMFGILEAVRWPTRERVRLAVRVGVFAAVVLVGTGIGTDLLTGDRSHIGSVRTALNRGVGRVFGHEKSERDPSAVGRAVDAGLPVAAGFAALVMLELLLLSAPDEPERDGDVRRRVGRLCTSGDSDSLGPFSRRQDRSFVFSDDGRAVVGYRVALGVCVAGPGPVGPPDAHADALAAWVRRCAERGWRPTMIGASDEARATASRIGMRGIHIGDEAVLPVAPFRLDQPSMRNVRQAVQRTRNAGVVVTVHREGTLDDGLRAALGDVVDDWRRGKGELGFTMTMDHLLDGTYPDAVLVVAHHAERPVGFQRYFLARAGSSLSLDVMPRRRNAPNGVNERLIAETLGWATRNGVEEVSLNFAAFRALFEAAPSPGRRLLRWGAHRLDPLINVESLNRFNTKFRPNWVPRHVLYRSVLDLGPILLAALRLEFGAQPVAQLGDAATPAGSRTSSRSRPAAVTSSRIRATSAWLRGRRRIRSARRPRR